MSSHCPRLGRTRRTWDLARINGLSCFATPDLELDTDASIVRGMVTNRGQSESVLSKRQSHLSERCFEAIVNAADLSFQLPSGADRYHEVRTVLD